MSCTCVNIAQELHMRHDVLQFWGIIFVYPFLFCSYRNISKAVKFPIDLFDLNE